MAESAASTAYGVVSQIALEQGLPKAQRIFDDPLAVQMLPSASRALVGMMGWRPLRAPLVRLMEKAAPGIGNEILSRKRYIDDALTVSLNSGINTVVILGAGLDTLAYRNSALMTAHVYEVDLPEIITYKTDKLRQLRPELPPYVTYVPIDFESQALDRLRRSEFLEGPKTLRPRPDYRLNKGLRSFPTEMRDGRTSPSFSNPRKNLFCSCPYTRELIQNELHV